MANSESTAPDWLKEDSEHDLNAPLSSSQQNNPLLGKKQTIFWILKICTIALSGLMAVTALLGLWNVRGIEDIGKVFVGVYMLVFSSILCSFEIIQILPWEQLDFLYRRNFGFLYGAKGKSFFIILYVYLFCLCYNILCATVSPF